MLDAQAFRQSRRRRRWPRHFLQGQRRGPHRLSRSLKLL